MAAPITYVYCIVQRSGRPVLARVPAGVPDSAGCALLPLEKSVWAVASRVDARTYGPGSLDDRLRDPDWLSRVALGHAAVVEHVARMRSATVVPLKVLTLFSDDDRARRDLLVQRPAWADALERVRGCVEWGVRVTSAAVPPPRRLPSRPSSGAAFLAGKKRSRDQARERSRRVSEAARDAFERLSRIATESRSREAPPHAAHPPLLDAAFLVAASRQARFDAAVARVAASCRQAGAELALTGPWPAYSFVQSGAAPS